MAIPEEYQGMVDEYLRLKQEFIDIRAEKEALKSYLLGIPNAVTAMNYLNGKIIDGGASMKIQELLEDYYEQRIDSLREVYDMLKERYEEIILEYGD